VRSVLVTGGAGFIGANFVHHWTARHPGDRVIVLDALTYAGNQANLEPARDHAGFMFVRGDICDEALVAKLFDDHGIDLVVHFAAESHVDRSILGPDAFIRTNVVGTHALLKCARRAWQRDGSWREGVRFHHVSTDEVYGALGSDDPPFTERTPYAPNSPYSASKAASDHLVRSYHHTFGMPVTTSNCSNNYGPYHFPEKLIPLILVKALSGEPLPVYGKGENVRDWLFVGDHCRGIELVIARGRVGETYNIGGCNEWRNIDIVRELCALLEQKFAADATLGRRFASCPAARGTAVESLISFVADRPGHDWRYAIDASKIERELGFRPAETFETGIRKTVDWYLSHESWWRAILDGSYRSGTEAT
jgi:dTDP-glucose 4,6-dehydratase